MKFTISAKAVEAAAKAKLVLEKRQQGAAAAPERKRKRPAKNEPAIVRPAPCRHSASLCWCPLPAAVPPTQRASQALFSPDVTSIKVESGLSCCVPACSIPPDPPAPQNVLGQETIELDGDGDDDDPSNLFRQPAGDGDGDDDFDPPNPRAAAGGNGGKRGRGSKAGRDEEPLDECGERVFTALVALRRASAPAQAPGSHQGQNLLVASAPSLAKGTCSRACRESARLAAWGEWRRPVALCSLSRARLRLRIMQELAEAKGTDHNIANIAWESHLKVRWESTAVIRRLRDSKMHLSWVSLHG
jgi:hypothetical protein